MDLFVNIRVIYHKGSCGEVPGVYTNVGDYVDWIEKEKQHI